MAIFRVPYQKHVIFPLFKFKIKMLAKWRYSVCRRRGTFAWDASDGLFGLHAFLKIHVQWIGRSLGLSLVQSYFSVAMISKFLF